MSLTPPRPRLIVEMVTIMERWRDRINASKGAAAAALSVSGERNRWVLSLTVVFRWKGQAANPLPNGAESGNGAGEQAGVDLE